MNTFEGHEDNLALQPSGKPFASKHDATPVSTSAPLPPGHPAFAVNKAKGGKTTAAFLRKIGD